MLIDGHAHACGSCYDVKTIEQYMEKHQIDGIVLCGGEPDSKKDYGYPMLSKIFRGEKLSYFFNKIICKVTALHKLSEEIDCQNDIVSAYAKLLPGKVFNAYWVNPLEDNCMEKMNAFFDKNGFRIIKLHQCWTPFDISAENCHKIFSWAQEKKLPVFIHLLSEEQVNAFVKMANQYSKVSFIVAHMIGAKRMADQLKNKNVYWDLSAPQLYSMDIMRFALKNYGANRLIAGSDTPYGKNNIEIVKKRLEKMRLTNAEYDAIACENICKLLGLTTI